MRYPASSVLGGTDDGLAAIGASFGVHAGIGAGLGEGAAEAALAGAGTVLRRPKRPVMPFMLPPAILTATSVGSFLDVPGQFGPPTGWFWDITSLSLSGFTAGSVAVAKNAPMTDANGNPIAVEPVASFTQAGIVAFPQKGNPLLAWGDRLVFSVTSAITGVVQISGSVIQVPSERIDDYVS